MFKNFEKFIVLLFLLVVGVFLFTTSFAASPSTLKRNDWRALQRFHNGIEVTGGNLTINGEVISGSEFSEVFYVDSTGGADTLGNDYGKSWEKPFASIDYAIGQCTAGQGDIIIVNPSHAKTMDEADEIDADVQATAMDDDLFDVDGGAILITSFVGVVTTNIVNATGNLEIKLDADSGWTDYDFSTAVDLDNDQAGQRIVFSDANESVLTPLAGADGGGTILMSGWYCGEGMIEQDNDDEDATGAIKWYMTWIPYEDGTTVTAQ